MVRRPPLIIVLVAVDAPAAAETPTTAERWGVFERAGGQALEVVWSSPTIDAQPIPSERLRHRPE